MTLTKDPDDVPLSEPGGAAEKHDSVPWLLSSQSRDVDLQRVARMYAG